MISSRSPKIRQLPGAVPERYIVVLGGTASARGAIHGGATTAAIDWVLANHVRPAVLTMSINPQGVVSDSLRTALDNLTRAGVTAVWSAGNMGSARRLDQRRHG